MRRQVRKLRRIAEALIKTRTRAAEGRTIEAALRAEVHELRAEVIAHEDRAEVVRGIVGEMVRDARGGRSDGWRSACGFYANKLRALGGLDVFLEQVEHAGPVNVDANGSEV